GCARGCNVAAQPLDGSLKRLVPRENPEVNTWWMCDEGRYDYRYDLADDRVTSCSLDGNPIDDGTAHQALADMLGEGAGRAGALVDPFLTCEEAHLAGRLATGAIVGGWTSRDGTAQCFPGGFTISAEKAPNRVGVEAVLGDQVFSGGAAALKSALEKGEIDTLVVFAGFPHPDLDPSWAGAIGKAKRRAVFTLRAGAWSEGADLVLPSASPFEKDGTYANEDGRLQRVRSYRAPGEVDWGSDLQRLQEILRLTGARNRVLSPASVFRELAEESSAFNGLSYSTIPPHGAPLAGHGAATVGAEGGAQ
ncbi:MAG: hypothetical protein ACO4B3_11950, partial [Planctomycetota bacterium]